MKENKNYSVEAMTKLDQFLPLTDENAQKLLDAWDVLDDYVLQEISLTSLFNTYQMNDDESEVLLKCVALNKFYSAGLLNIDLIPMAKHIVELNSQINIDKALQEGDWTIVSKIAQGGELSRSYLSFASKYCNWHNPKKFPIYDKYVVDVLCALKNKGVTLNFSKIREIRDDANLDKRYQTFGNALQELVKHFKLKFPLDKASGEIIYKILDRALWILGKFCFGNGVSVADIALALGEILLRVTWDKYIVCMSKKGTIKVIKAGETSSNTKESLREISKQIGFTPNDKWNTRQFGKNLIEFINTKK